ncbi:MAG: sigma-70 family RNA polymerase sigma factor [Bacteroidetes bacterium]|nr:sigma-70 family RNA polymerase sigma factor [Bacteroidota bacterium]
MTERELIEGCLKKDSRCQRRLFDLFAGKMMSVCRRYARDEKEAEDMLQESFVRIFSFINQYRSEGSLEGWLRKIVVNCCLNIIRKRKPSFSEIDEEQPNAPSIAPQALSTLDEDQLLKLIAALPDGYRLVFNLYVLEGYDHNEIGEMLNITAGTSRSQLSKARGLLKTQIENLQKLPNKYA